MTRKAQNTIATGGLASSNLGALAFSHGYFRHKIRAGEDQAGQFRDSDLRSDCLSAASPDSAEEQKKQQGITPEEVSQLLSIASLPLLA